MPTSINIPDIPRLTRAEMQLVHNSTGLSLHRSEQWGGPTIEMTATPPEENSEDIPTARVCMTTREAAAIALLMLAMVRTDEGGADEPPF